MLARLSVAVFECGDRTEMAELLAPDVRYEEPASGCRAEGAEAVLDALAAWPVAFPDSVAEVVRVLTNGDTAVLEIVWHGTHDGPLVTPAGTVPATGHAVDCWATRWQRWSGGRLVHERNHVDVLTLLAQIGAAPAPT
jgi:steroid delta-isomerase-like uncharacterized protein